MIITLSGEAGSGKSTCARGLAEKLNLKHYSIGDLMRLLAAEKNMTLMELSKLAEQSSAIDTELDNKQIELGKNHDNFIIDGRLSACFIPHAVKIFLTADINERARRIFADKRHVESSATVEEAKQKIIERKNSEIKRYQTWYNFNPYDLSKYDIVYDSTDKPAEIMTEEIKIKIAEMIRSAEKK